MLSALANSMPHLCQDSRGGPLGEAGGVGIPRRCPPSSPCKQDHQWDLEGRPGGVNGQAAARESRKSPRGGEVPRGTQSSSRLAQEPGRAAGRDGPAGGRASCTASPPPTQPKVKGSRAARRGGDRGTRPGSRSDTCTHFATSPEPRAPHPPTHHRAPPPLRWVLRASFPPGLALNPPRPAVAEPPVPPRVAGPWPPPPPGSPQQAGILATMLCFLRGMAFVPFLLVTWSSAAFIISYVVAVLSGHVNPFFPYISDTGTTPPESGIFGFMINFSAFLGAATMYTRYKIVEKQNQTSYFSTPVFNLVSLALGLVGCIGMGIVANFQELAVPVVHDSGALLAFVCGVVYTLLQSVISYKSCPQWNSLTTCHIRMAISAVSCAAVVPMIAYASLISITKLEWNPKEKDYVYHVVSATCEWTVAFGFIFYFLTFIQDFQNVTLRISTELTGDI